MVNFNYFSNINSEKNVIHQFKYKITIKVDIVDNRWHIVGLVTYHSGLDLIGNS